MCGGGGSQDYGDLAGGIAGMFASSPQGGMAAGSVPAPAMRGDTMSGIGGFMPAQTAGFAPQTAGLGSGSYMTPQTPMFAAEAMYSPEAAAQARLASMPQTQAMSVADLTPNATAAAAEPEPATEGLNRAQQRQVLGMMGYSPISTATAQALPGGMSALPSMTDGYGNPVYFASADDLAYFKK